MSDQDVGWIWNWLTDIHSAVTNPDYDPKTGTYKTPTPATPTTDSLFVTCPCCKELVYRDKAKCRSVMDCLDIKPKGEGL